MAGSEVGFSFQADVANAGSLAHLMTGRALKALSDGGVDFYAVIAINILGKNFVVSSTLEATTHSHVVAKGRTGIQAVLAKALKIGWGHSGLAEDMTRTRAGTNALLLLGALATGSTYFSAAECLSKLLSLHGCEADKLPNIDVLKHMIGYLAPFVRDLGFPKILGHVTATAMGVLNAKWGKNEEAKRHLTAHGDAQGLAGAVNQLMLTSKRHETIYLVTKMRGAWLATFASHILGMAVELRFDDTIIWESAGSNGTAIFELGQHQIDQPVSHRHKRITLVQPLGPERQPEVVVSYPIRDAFDSLIVQFPMVDNELKDAIRRAICRMSNRLLNSFHRRQFNRYEALLETLGAFGFESAFVDSVIGTLQDFGRCEFSGSESKIGLASLDRSLETLLRACGEHGELSYPTSPQIIDEIHPSISPWKNDCLCCHIGKLIAGFASAAIALMQCQFDALELMLSGYLLLWDHGPFSTHYAAAGVSGNRQQCMAYIMSLTCNDDDELRPVFELRSRGDAKVLGYSGGSYTLYYTGIMRNECYDTQGRVLSLSSGRASIDGVLRSILSEYGPSSIDFGYHYGRDWTLLGPGSTIEPYYIPSDTKIHLDAFLDEDSLQLRFTVKTGEIHGRVISIANCMTRMKLHPIRRCNHNPDTKFEVEKGYDLEVAGFDYSTLIESQAERITSNAVRLFALRGNKLEQIVMAFCLYRRGLNEECEFQLQACLKCCIKGALGKKLDYSRNVIMGG